ncbi:telomere silencing protein zds1 protein [Diplodia corticola]|uniref:Telomere silencing protein zds1 protein n=1 Tax=Diplodia corticola TaxID=236234 RepID=A0A1J9RCW8_9PEZI|nr:telomere silencing protein zds1 protein [Diplodia corticola]OJD30355.1 telomere silencing protein zds1 protein [Diplodia corticola]
MQDPDYTAATPRLRPDPNRAGPPHPPPAAPCPRERMLTAPHHNPQTSETPGSHRALELERLYEARRGHAPQISISDDSHHITEAIGDMYGENEYSRSESRPLSFISSPTSETFDLSPSFPASPNSLERSSSNEHKHHANGQPASPNMLSPRSDSFDRSSVSPPRLNRQSSDTASQAFEFQDIDSQSTPAAVAQELSNLQAIRRMSMDVHGSDPDLPSFGDRPPMPAAAPAHEADEDDPSRMFWVPARVHPELAPKEFRTFIEEKVQKHRRRSGDSDSMLSADGLSPEGSSGGLRRKKSMLSKQVDGPHGYRDGAERLERKRSQASDHAHMPTLHQLEAVEEDDPAQLIRRMSLRDSMDSGVAGVESAGEDDVPILPVKPTGILKRSTRTNYRRGSIRKGERVPFSRRMGKQGDTDTDESPVSSPIAQEPEVKRGIQRVQTEPMPSKADQPENFSRPTRLRSQAQGPNAPQTEPSRPRSAEERPASPPEQHGQTSPPQQDGQRRYHSRIASNGRTTALLPGYNVPIDSPVLSSTAAPVPQIVETPPAPADVPPPIPAQHPERKSSKVQVDHSASQNHAPVKMPPQPVRGLPPGRQSLREKAEKAQANKIPSQSLDEMASHPTAIPGHTSATRSDSLAIIPTFADESKSDKGDKKSRNAAAAADDDDEESGGRKTSWGWFSRKNKEKEEEEEREKKTKDEKEHKKTKSKLTKSADKSHDKHDKHEKRDNARLDVLQASIDDGRGRESLVLDRNNIKLDEERQKTSSRKTSSEKKEKEGLFSSIFGGKAKKGEKEAHGSSKKAISARGLSPDPPQRVLRPDIDYNWTRFSILEERAIYRMAHIKLANPRRELYSQVLLSNFMYSYLAKVQQMHPHIQIGQSAAQKQQQRLAQEQKKREEEQRRQQQQQQPEEFKQYQMYQDQQARVEAKEGTSEGTAYQHGDNQYLNDPSHASQHTQYNRTNGNGYSVSSGSSYLGQPGAQPQQAYYEPQYEDDDGRSEMW